MIRNFIVAVIVSTLQFALAAEDPCHPVVDGKVTSVETKIVTASELLPITPKNFSAYREKVRTLDVGFQSKENFPAVVGQRYQVSDHLPKFMFYRVSKDGIYEMREFGGKSRFFKIQNVAGKIRWTGVDPVKPTQWAEEMEISKTEAQPEYFDSLKMDRAELIKKIAANTGEASKTVSNKEQNPARAKAAAEGLTNAAEYIVGMIEKKQDFTIERLEKLHELVANGTIQTPNGDLGLGILRGSGPRCVTSNGSYVIADMSKTSVRMGEQTVMSYTAPQDVKSALESLMVRINAVNPKTSPAEIADIYTQFIATHPFIDGNGRTSRMLVQFMQMKMKTPVTRLNEKAAFSAFYLKPNELSQIIFEKPQVNKAEAPEFNVRSNPGQR